MIPLEKSNNFIDYETLKNIIKQYDLKKFLSDKGFEIKSNKMCCPFCGSGTGSHKTPALHIFPDNYFKCFSCQEHGDVIDFVMKTQGLEYPAAILHIAHELGIPIPEHSGFKPLPAIKVQIGKKLIFDQMKDSIVEVPVYRRFHSQEAVDAYLLKQEMEREENLCVALASIAMMIAKHDEDLDLIIGLMGTPFEKEYYSLMKDKRLAFGKIIEWNNKNFQPKKRR